MKSGNLIHESAAETAKKLRKALKEKFPNSKFSVRSSSYSYSSSVTAYLVSGDPVDWDECSKVCRSFASSTFDGMTDGSEVHGYKYTDGKFYFGADYVRYGGERR